MKFKRRWSPVTREKLVDAVNAARNKLALEETRGTGHAEYEIAKADFYAAVSKLGKYDKERPR